MRLTDGYTLRHIHGTSYLLPVGQKIADHKRSIQLNHSSVFLWNALQENTDTDYLLHALINHYETSTEDSLALQEDVNTFVKQMFALGLLYEDPAHDNISQFLRFANLTIGYCGPDNLLNQTLLDFKCNAAPVDQTWTIVSHMPATPPTGTLLLRTNELEVIKNDTFYILSYPSGTLLRECHITLDGTLAYFYCAAFSDEKLNEQLNIELFNAYRFAFLLFAQTKGYFALHSSSILYQNKAWLFSAPSGTGKSTHTNLWNDLYQTPILDGDLNLISIKNQQAVIWGIPWCGTSGIYTTMSYPLGGIILLKQYTTDCIQPLFENEKQLQVMQRFISPAWTTAMLDVNLTFSGELIKHIAVFKLLCTKNHSAVYTIKEQIDDILI